MSHNDVISVASSATPTDLGVSTETGSYANLPRDVPEADSGAEPVGEAVDNAGDESPAWPSSGATNVHRPVPDRDTIKDTNTDASTAQNPHAQGQAPVATGADSSQQNHYGYSASGGMFAPSGLSSNPFGYGYGYGYGLGSQLPSGDHRPSSSVVELNGNTLGFPAALSYANLHTSIHQTLTLRPDGTPHVHNNTHLDASSHATGYSKLDVESQNCDTAGLHSKSLSIRDGQQTAPPSLAALTQANDDHTRHASEAAASLLSAMANVKLGVSAADTSTSASGEKA